MTCALAATLAFAAELPRIQTNGQATQFIVDGKPFLMLAGELHNSSASSVEYLRPLFTRLSALNLNTVIGTVSWELLEPEEGRFDYTLVDAQIREARSRDMRLVLIWFGTWKNATSTYVPEWIKKDPARFPRMKVGPKWQGPTFWGEGIESLSPFGEATLTDDSKAFAALMRHIREFDPQHTVVMMQMENESGLLGDSRDRSALAEAAWSKAVPAGLLSYLAKNRSALLPETLKVWSANGYKTSGTWSEVFGTDPFAEEAFMAWHIGQYIGKVTSAGKAELNLPMYVNAWLGPQPGMDRPGQYPSGGPVARVMDIWRAAAPNIDLLAPDIYIEDFKGVCAEYARSGNPLFIPESRALVGSLFWAVGQHGAMGFSPFGIEDVPADHQLGEAYAALRELTPVLTRYQAEGAVRGILADRDADQTISLGGYRLTVAAHRPQPWETAPTVPALPGRQQSPETRARGLVIATGPGEFLFVGSGMDVRFDPESPGSGHAGFLSIDEGRYVRGEWVPGRRLNGDEQRVSLRQDRVGILKVRLYRHE